MKNIIERSPLFAYINFGLSHTITCSSGLPQVLESPGKSWNLKSVLESPGKSWDLLIFLKNPGKVLEFYTMFVP